MSWGFFGAGGEAEGERLSDSDNVGGLSQGLVSEESSKILLRGVMGSGELLRGEHDVSTDSFSEIQKENI